MHAYVSLFWTICACECQHEGVYDLFRSVVLGRMWVLTQIRGMYYLDGEFTALVDKFRNVNEAVVILHFALCISLPQIIVFISVLLCRNESFKRTKADISFLCFLCWLLEKKMVLLIIIWNSYSFITAVNASRNSSCDII